MSVFTKSDNLGDTKTEQLVDEINTLLEKMKTNGSTQKGGASNVVSDINHLLSEYNGARVNYSQEELETLELLGGASKKKKSVAKSTARKTNSKSKRKSKSKSQKGGATKPKSKSKKVKVSKASKKTKSKSVEKPKMKREMNPAMKASIDLKAFIKGKVGDKQKLNNVAAMSKVAWKILKENDKDLEKSKNAFKLSSFLKDYDEAVQEVEKNREAKKAAKNA